MIKSKVTKLREPVGVTFSTVITGDVCPRTPYAVENVIHNSEAIVADVKPFIVSADLKIMQWETTLTQADTPIDKSGPNLKCDPECLNFGKALNIDVMLLANNHVGDFGPEVVIETINHIEKAGFKHVGAGKDLADAKKTLYLECKGRKVAIINFAENEFGTAGPHKPGVAPMAPFDNIRQIKEARKSADTVIVTIHGGHEHYSYPSPRMVEVYRQYASAGADAVWGCHTHCVVGGEVFETVPIIYSPGNFYFPKGHGVPIPNIGWNTGYLTKFHFDEKGVYAIEIQPYRFGAEDPITKLSAEDEKLFFEFYQKISAPIADPERLMRLFEAWCTHSGINYLGATNRDKVETWPPDWSQRDMVKSWLPVRNLFTCEAHNDLVRTTLRLIEEYRIDEAAKLRDEVLALQRPSWMTK